MLNVCRVSRIAFRPEAGCRTGAFYRDVTFHPHPRSLSEGIVFFRKPE
jgi:hypothetical protein